MHNPILIDTDGHGHAIGDLPVIDYNGIRYYQIDDGTLIDADGSVYSAVLSDGQIRSISQVKKNLDYIGLNQPSAPVLCQAVYSVFRANGQWDMTLLVDSHVIFTADDIRKHCDLNDIVTAMGLSHCPDSALLGYIVDRYKNTWRQIKNKEVLWVYRRAFYSTQWTLKITSSTGKKTIIKNYIR